MGPRKQKQRRKKESHTHTQTTGWESLDQLATASATTLLAFLGGIKGVDFLYKVEENLVDIGSSFGGTFQKDAIPLLGQRSSLIRGDDSLIRQVTFVSGEHHWNGGGVLHAKDLLADVIEVVERGLGDDGVDQYETLSVFHVEITHGGELLGTGRVENLEHALFAVDFHLFSVRVLDSWVVLLHEDSLHKLNG